MNSPEHIPRKAAQVEGEVADDRVWKELNADHLQYTIPVCFNTHLSSVHPHSVITL